MEVWIPVVLGVIGLLTLILTGIGKWVMAVRAREEALLKEIRELQKMRFDDQQERIRYEIVRRESVDKSMQVMGDLAQTVPALRLALLELSNKGGVGP